MLVVLKNGIAAVVTCKVSGSLSRHLTYVPLGKHDDVLHNRDDIKDTISLFNLLFKSFKNSLRKLGTQGPQEQKMPNLLAEKVKSVSVKKNLVANMKFAKYLQHEMHL